MTSKQIQLIFLALAILLGIGWWWYRQPRYSSGEKAPEFSMELANGKQFHSSELNGKYVLIHFWGSWCPPCRAENPHLVELYKMYHEKGFEIVSIGIETNEDRWKRAIERDQMNWPYHHTDLREFDGELARLFNVHSIPTTFLVNPEGDVVAVKPHPSEIGQILSKNL